jgi:hypothetical protein
MTRAHGALERTVNRQFEISERLRHQVAAAETAQSNPRVGRARADSIVQAAGAGISAIQPGATYVVPPPTGVAATDTANILQILNASTPGSTVVFQWSPDAAYSINQELVIQRGVRLTGNGNSSQAFNGATLAGAMPLLQQAAGTDLACILGSFSFLAGLYGPSNPGLYPAYNNLYNNGTVKNSVDSGVEIDHLAFDGQNGGSKTGNTQGHGVVIFTYGAKLHDCVVLNAAEIGIWLADANYAGQGSTNENHENRIQDNLVINPGKNGIRVDNDYGGSGGATDGHILRNTVYYPSKQLASAGPNIDPDTKLPHEALRMKNAAGWWIVDNRLVACPGNGAFFNTTGGLHLVGNTIDGFGCSPVARTSYIGYAITTAGQTKLHPGRIIGNLAVAYEAANPFSSRTAATSNTYRYFELAMQTDPGRLVQPTYQAYPTHSDNVAHQGSQLPAPIPGASIPTGNLKKVVLPPGASAGVAVGMGVADSKGRIPAGAKVTKVTAGAGGASDSLLISAAASSGGAVTISFVGPTSVAWTYVNALVGADMIVHRTNEVATGTIDPDPAIQIKVTSNSLAPTVTLVDPADYIGEGLLAPQRVPSAGEMIVSAGGELDWQPTVQTSSTDNSASGVLGGKLPSPSFAAHKVTVMTSSGQYAVPSWAVTVKVVCVGGGGGGGGGLSGAANQVGGGGGAAGTTSVQTIAVGSLSTLDTTVGAGGGGGGPGQDGAPGQASTVSASGVAIVSSGGVGGAGAAAGTGVANGGSYGGPGTAPTASAASGGQSGAKGGEPFSWSPGGGGGGGPSGQASGGSGGAAGSAIAGGVYGVKGAAGGPKGGDGQDAVDLGGGGGGGGAGIGTPGSGGSGASGFVVIEVVT